MQPSFLYELIGYTGSILVAISLMMKSLIRLRIINMVGAIFFILYGLLIGAIPVAFLNGLILCVNLYNLWHMWQEKDSFKLMEVSYDSPYLQNFLEFYRQNILEFFPTYLFKPKSDQVVVFVLRNMIPAGVLIVKPNGEEANIFLDFVIPGYRDFRAGKFLFEASALFFSQKGIKYLVSDCGNAQHEAYLQRMGFRIKNNLYYRDVQSLILSKKTF